MSSRICSIDVGNDLLSAAILQGEGRKKQTLVYVVVEVVDSRPIEELFAELISKLNYQGEACYVSFNAEFFKFRNLLLPFSDRKTIDKVLPFELEELVSESSDEIVVDSIINKGTDGKHDILAAFLSNEFLASWLATMQIVDIDPEIITVSGLASATRLLTEKNISEPFLYLYIGLQRASLIRIESGSINFVRSLIFDPGMEVGYQLNPTTRHVVPLRPENVEHALKNFCTELNQTILAIGCPEKTVIQVAGVYGDMVEIVETINTQSNLSCEITDRDGSIAMGDNSSLPVVDATSSLFAHAIDLSVQVNKGVTLMNFRKGSFVFKRSFAENKSILLAVAAVVCCAIVGSFAYLLYDYTQIVNKKDAVTQEIRAVFKKTLPGVTRIVDPVQQLQVEVNNLKAGNREGGDGNSSFTVLDIFADISRQIPASLDVSLKRMIIDDKGVRIMGFTDNFNTVDAIKKALEQSAIFVEVDINSANLDQKSSKIKFEIKLDLGEV